MSTQCVISACQRPANVLCHCCNENLCRNHYSEHDYLNSKLNLLADEIDSFDRELLSVDVKKYIQNSNDRLQQWRLDGYKNIDQYCEQKYREIEQYLLKIINHKRESIEHIRTNMLDIVKDRRMTLEVIDSLSLNLHAIVDTLTNIDQRHLSIQTTPLVVDRGCIQIDEISAEGFELGSITPVYGTIEYTRPGVHPIASNEQFLIMHREPHLCLVDRNLKVVKQNAWKHEPIVDMCWSTALTKFVVLTLNRIFIVDVDSMTIERVETTQKLQWLSCTCSDTSLFLSTNERGSSICEFNLLNSMQAAKRWEPPDTCTKDERIHDMIYHKGTLLMMIESPQAERVRVELRSSARLDRLWSLPLDIDVRSKFYTCCLLNYDQWLIVDTSTSQLLQITMDGKLKSSCEYSPVPTCACLFGFDLLAVSTENGVNFHKL